ncbi:MFS transporter, partial [Actinacidiphila guanduensis]
PFSVFRRRALTVANGVTVAIGSANFGGYFFLSLYLQQVTGYSPLRAGFGFLPIGLTAFLGAFFGTRLVARLGVRNQLVLGPAVAAFGLIWMSLTVTPDRAYAAHLLVPLVLFGVGTGMTFVPMAMAGTQGMPPHQAGLASALINTTRQVGGAIGLAVMSTAATALTRHHLTTEHPPSAFTDGYALAFLIAGLGLVAAALLALTLPSVPTVTATSTTASSGQPTPDPATPDPATPDPADAPRPAPAPAD